MLRKAIPIVIVLFSVTLADASQQNVQSDASCTLAIVAKSVAGKRARLCDRDVVRQMAQQGHVFEQNQMGIASILAIEPGYSLSDAVQWFQRAALKGYAPAQVNLGLMYCNGWGVEQNYGACLRWLKAAVDQKYARAYFDLGILYFRGTGVRQNNSQALQLFRQAAELDDSSGQANLGYMYDQGLGVVRDLHAAARWYRKSADNHNAMGENNLADMYLRGDGVARDDAAAFRLFSDAAVQGHTGAQIKLGYMYSAGRGTRIDRDKAYEWIMAASLAGDDRGKYLLESLRREMQAQEIRQATDRARAWKLTQSEPIVKTLVP